MPDVLNTLPSIQYPETDRSHFTGLTGDKAFNADMTNTEKFTALGSVIGTQDSLQLYGKGLIGYTQDPFSALAGYLGLKTPPSGYTWEYRPKNPLTSSSDITIEGLQNPSNWALYSYSPKPAGGGVFDTLFSSGFVNTFVENPISALTNTYERFTSPVGSDLPQFTQAAVNPPKVNFVKVGVESGVNLLSDVGFAFGVEGATQGVSATSAASRALPAGTYGPVSPGFWGSIGEGNIGNAWQIAKNTFGVAVESPSTSLSRAGGTLLTQQAVQTFVKYTGDVGKGLLQLLTLDFAGALTSFGVLPTPGSTQLLYGPSSSSSDSGGGGGGGYLPNTNTGQVNANGLLFPIIVITGIGFLIWYLWKKR